MLDNLIAQKRVPAMIAIMIQNGGGDAQGSQRGLEYDTMSGKFAEFIEAEVLPAVEKTLRREAHAQARGPRGHGLQLGRGGGALDGLVSPGVVPPRHQLLGHVREPAVAVQPGDAGRRLGLSRVDHRERQSASPSASGCTSATAISTTRTSCATTCTTGWWLTTAWRRCSKDKGYHYQYVYALDSGHCDRKVREQTLPQALEWVWRGYK